MEGLDPGLADGEERAVELRPRTRSNPEGAEDRRSSNGGMNSPTTSLPAVGSRVEGEGEAASTESTPSSTTTITSTVPTPIAGAATTSSSTVATSGPKPCQASLSAQISPASELQLKVPRVNCPEKVVSYWEVSKG